MVENIVSRHGNMVTHAYISLYHAWYFGFSTTWSSKMQSINNIIENEPPPPKNKEKQHQTFLKVKRRKVFFDTIPLKIYKTILERPIPVLCLPIQQNINPHQCLHL